MSTRFWAHCVHVLLEPTNLLNVHKIPPKHVSARTDRPRRQPPPCLLQLLETCRLSQSSQSARTSSAMIIPAVHGTAVMAILGARVHPRNHGQSCVARKSMDEEWDLAVLLHRLQQLVCLCMAWVHAGPAQVLCGFKRQYIVCVAARP